MTAFCFTRRGCPSYGSDSSSRCSTVNRSDFTCRGVRCQVVCPSACASISTCGMKALCTLASVHASPSSATQPYAQNRGAEGYHAGGQPCDLAVTACAVEEGRPSAAFTSEHIICSGLPELTLQKRSKCHSRVALATDSCGCMLLCANLCQQHACQLSTTFTRGGRACKQPPSTSTTDCVSHMWLVQVPMHRAGLDQHLHASSVESER